MTRIYASIVALVLASGGLVTTASAQSAEVKRACDAINMLAPLVMQQRQAGAPIADIMPYANMAEGPVRGLVQRMIREAYEVPRVSNPQQAISDYQKRWVADCYASYN